MKNVGKLQIWDVQNNVPIYKECEADNQSQKSSKSITNLIYNETRSTIAICYADNTVILQSFGPHFSEKTV